MTTSETSTEGAAVRDLATSAATWTIREETVGAYLARFGIYDPATRTINQGNIPDSVYQRANNEISNNPIKKRMLRDLLRGGTLPAVVTVETSDGRYEIADGLQRTHVLAVAAEGLLALEHNEQPSREVQGQLNDMADQNQQPLDLDRFLAQPLVEQVWRGLNSDEKLRLFMVLKVGQQKVSPRHLLEVAQSDLRATFKDWGIGLLTEREEKEMPRPRGRRPKDASPLLSVATTHYRYELLFDGLYAYVSGDPYIKTSKVLQDGRPSDKFDNRIIELGSEACREDFTWVCLELNRKVQDRYEGNARWKKAVQVSDSFLVPLFAALGQARENADTGSTVRHHQQELLEVLDQPGDDPLALFTGPDSLESIYATVRSNIGRRQRAIAFFAWHSFFLQGPSSTDYPLSWRDAAIRRWNISRKRGPDMSTAQP